MAKGKITRNNPFGVDEYGNSGPIEMSSEEFAQLLNKTKNPNHRNVEDLTPEEKTNAIDQFFRPDGRPPITRTEPPEVLPPQPESTPKPVDNVDTSSRPVKVDHDEDVDKT